MDEIDTEDQLRTWIASNIGVNSAHLQPLCSITRVGEAWIVAPPPGKRGTSTLIVASDGSIAKAQISARPVISLKEVILFGAWKTNEDLVPVYPQKVRLPFHEEPLARGPGWMQKLAEMERQNLE